MLVSRCNRSGIAAQNGFATENNWMTDGGDFGAKRTCRDTRSRLGRVESGQIVPWQRPESRIQTDTGIPL